MSTQISGCGSSLVNKHELVIFLFLKMVGIPKCKFEVDL